jgi:hypothetical protein
VYQRAVIGCTNLKLEVDSLKISRKTYRISAIRSQTYHTQIQATTRDASGSGKCGYDVYPPASVPASPAFARPLACTRAEIPARAHARARRVSAGIGQPVTRKRRPPNLRWRAAGRRRVRRRQRPGRHPAEERTVVTSSSLLVCKKE